MTYSIACLLHYCRYPDLRIQRVQGLSLGDTRVRWGNLVWYYWHHKFLYNVKELRPRNTVNWSRLFTALLTCRVHILALTQGITLVWIRLLLNLAKWPIAPVTLLLLPSLIVTVVWLCSRNSDRKFNSAWKHSNRMIEDIPVEEWDSYRNKILEQYRKVYRLWVSRRYIHHLCQRSILSIASEWRTVKLHCYASCTRVTGAGSWCSYHE